MASLKEEDEMVQEAALNELTELMSMSSEEALTVLPLEQLVPQLVCHLSQTMLWMCCAKRLPSLLLLLKLKPVFEFE